MKILYVAYSCLPFKGSEEKIGWNIPFESAKTNQVYVVTKTEHKEKIQEYLINHNIENITFYYVDIPKIYKKLFKGIAYFARLNVWHKKALPVVKEICKNEKIDIIHQITPIEFRSIGDYHQINGTKFVCGPLGGGEFLPQGLKSYAKNNMAMEYVRTLINKYFRKKHQLTGKLKKCDYILFANNETKDYLSHLVDNVPNDLFFDNGIDDSEFTVADKLCKKPQDNIVFLVSGRLAYRKGHRFLLDVLAQIPNDMNYQCRIVGGGPELERTKALCKQYGLSDKVVFTGRIPYDQMTKEYENADVLIMPSIRETTGAVLLEAMSKGLPVITINKFGGSVLLNEKSGWLYCGNSTDDYKQNLKSAIIQCITDPDQIYNRGICAKESAKQGLWCKKLEFYNSIYKKLI